jgi:3',5'-cyclic AMP phosphodiesterase CpdA
MNISIMNTFLFFLALLWGCGEVFSDVEPIQDPSETAMNVDADSILFAVIGDYGLSGEGERTVANMVKSWRPEFIVTTGDNNYGPEDLEGYSYHIGQYYCDYIYNFDVAREYRCFGKANREKQNRFFPSPGNHDADGPQLLEAYLEYFTLPGKESYYAFSWGDVAFYSINSLEFADLEEQKAWLEDKISKSDKTFQIVYFHHPPYTSGGHVSAPRMQWEFFEWGVDVVLSGHDHIYARFEHADEEGLHYIVNGLGGRKKYSCREDYEEEGVKMHLCYDTNYGAMRCTANSSQLIMEFYTIDDPSSPLDRLVIEK